MAKAAKNKKSIILEGVEVFYHEKSDTFSIISTDPDLPKGDFFMKVKEGTQTDLILRKLFSQKTGNNAPIGTGLTADIPQETITLTDSEMSRRYDKYTFPLGVSKNQETVILKIDETDFPTNVLISGWPGVGKTVITEQILRKAEISGIPVLKWTGETYPKDKLEHYLEKASFMMELESLFSGETVRTEPTIVIIDGLYNYLKSETEENHPEAFQSLMEAASKLAHFLSLSRSKMVTFVMTLQRADLELMKKFSPYVGMNIVGTLSFVESTIVLKTSEAPNLKNGTFIVKTATETKGMKAYHPAMKSDWV